MKTIINQRFKKPSTRRSEKREAKLVDRYPYVRLARIDSPTVTMTTSLAWKTNDPAPSVGLEDRRRTAKMSFWPGARRVVNNAGVVALVAANVSEIGYAVSRSIAFVASSRSRKSARHQGRSRHRTIRGTKREDTRHAEGRTRRGDDGGDKGLVPMSSRGNRPENGKSSDLVTNG